ncbi:PAS domain S-box protein [Benzoatithermus flavus]|uniref:histidine kinase n=1 Tax=Benzoatithermus flavus TaxID=3108223 RepID=A0ABU8XP59_9PROT
MMPPPLPPDESARLEALHRLDILDTAPEPVFDRIARLAASLFAAPIAFVSLVDAERQWFKARCGIDTTETPREHAFCAHAILASAALVVEDAHEDPRFADSPLVTDTPRIRFYAGAPIVTSDGFRLGAVCAIDTVPRSPTAEQIRGLEDLAAIVATQLELRRTAQEHTIYRAMVEAMPDQVYAKDPDSRFIAANLATAAFMGVASAKDLVGRSDTDFHPPELAEAYRRHEQAVLARGEAIVVEEIVRRRDGSTRWLCSLKAPIRDERGRIVGLVGHNRDITAEKRLREELAATRQHLQDALENMADGLVLYDQDERIVLWNRKVEELFPRSLEERVAGRPIHELARAMALRGEYKGIGALDAECWFAEQYAGFLSPEGSAFETASGIWLQGIARRTSSGGLVVVYRDITRLKHAEAAAQANAARLGAILDTVLDGIVTIDEQGTIEAVNPAAERLFGYAAEEMIGRSITMLMPETHRLAHGDRIARYLVTGERRAIRIGCEGEGRRKDGAVFPVELTVGETRLHGRRLLTGVVRDVTERKERERELAAARVAAEAAAEAKARFLAQMSHEIRTPMTAVLGFAELLRASVLDPEQKAQVEIILKTGRDLLAILNDVLDFSKLEAGKLEIAHESFRLDRLLQELVSVASVLLADKPVGFELLADPSLPSAVTGDPIRLKQVLTNLLGNAAKFTEKGWIRLQAMPASDRVVRFAVTDTGPGIAPEQRGKLFESFSQLDTTRGRHGGTGLGLAISKQLVERMGGRIGAESASGQGSTFWFELPLSPAAEAPSPSPPAEVGMRPLSVLVADDVFTNRELLKALLQRDGHRVRLVVNGAEAVTAVRDEVPDLVLMDVSMPEMDGLEATRRIRSLGGAAESVPIVAITAHAFAADVEACRNAGMNDHLAKPIDPQKLREVLARIGPRSAGASRDAVPPELTDVTVARQHAAGGTG